jgi:integrase
MKWIDPKSGEWREKSIKQTRRANAELVADDWSIQLSQGALDHEVSWQHFRDRYEAEVLPFKSKETADKWRTVAKKVERYLSPQILHELSSSGISHLASHLKKSGVSDATVANNLRHLQAALNWAFHMGMLETAPVVRMPTRSRAIVKVNSDSESGKVKYASAQDLRRSFGARWASKVLPVTLKKLMRHETIETTMKFYVGHMAERTADDVWRAFRDEFCDTFCDTPKNEDIDSQLPK